MNSRLDTYIRRARRSFFLGPARKQVGVRTVDDEPGGLVAHRARLTALSAAIALGLPVVAGVALIPLRPHLAQSISLIMVVPVFLIAAVAGARPGVVAAVSAGVTFDVLHTIPYYRFTIDDPDDIVEMVVLVAVGIVTGFIADAALGAVESTRVRHRELTALTDFLARIGRSDPDALIDEAGRSISALLLAHECRWQPGYRGTASPVLNPTGTITVSGVGTHLDSSAARLPPDLEIAVGQPPQEHGRFLVRTSSAEISVEERYAAGSIASTLGKLLDLPVGGRAPESG